MVPLTDLPMAGRLEMEMDGHVVFADYRRRPGRLIVDDVEAPTSVTGSTMI